MNNKNHFIQNVKEKISLFKEQKKEQHLVKTIIKLQFFLPDQLYSIKDPKNIEKLKPYNFPGLHTNWMFMFDPIYLWVKDYSIVGLMKTLKNEKDFSDTLWKDFNQLSEELTLIFIEQFKNPNNSEELQRQMFNSNACVDSKIIKFCNQYKFQHYGTYFIREICLDKAHFIYSNTNHYISDENPKIQQFVFLKFLKNNFHKHSYDSSKDNNLFEHPNLLFLIQKGFLDLTIFNEAKKTSPILITWFQRTYFNNQINLYDGLLKLEKLALKNDLSITDNKKTIKVL